MAEWGRKEYSKAWPSRRPVWTWGALFGYGTGRSCAAQLVTLQEVFAQAMVIYAGEPDIVAALAAWEAAIAAQEADGDL